MCGRLFESNSKDQPEFRVQSIKTQFIKKKFLIKKNKKNKNGKSPKFKLEVNKN